MGAIRHEKLHEMSWKDYEEGDTLGVSHVPVTCTV